MGGQFDMIPAGLIALWYGTIGNIPAGWHICDGTAGTPDLRDKFIIGAGSTYAVGANGGAVNHNHPFTGDGHFHNVASGIGIAAGTDWDTVTDTQPAGGTTDNASSLPPYHALAYIMKI